MNNNNPVKKLILGFNSKLCLCKKCPNYPGHKDKVVYCERAKSPYVISKTSCLCPQCRVWKLNHFAETYYCSSGAAPLSRI
ncbi:DUF2769 domain-containing protein [Dehalococcoides mccartyi]|uniref:DUF2769 domain-containing protein n=1 Tax=Dehalococcoides mccartyi TaxID=61435 RepID=UPI0009B5A458